MYGYNLAIWSFWSQLSPAYKLYWIILSLVGLYTFFSAGSIAKRVRVLNHRADSSEISRIRLEARVANLRQVIFATFFLFGALFFLAIPSAFNTMADGKGSPLNDIIGGFRLHFAYAANVFLVLLILHCTQWFVSRRIVLAK